MDEKPKILFVDDEPGIRATLPVILDRAGFTVTSAATVAEALHLIATEKFDILIADLNIGQPSDGFTVVSAMRRTQPHVVNFILTGYPAFETALEALRQQVDDYLVKPADIRGMLDKIKQRLNAPKKAVPERIETQRLAEILTQNKREIIQRWLNAAREDLQIASSKLPDTELTSYLPSVIEEIIIRGRGQEPSEQELKTAELHGRARFQQGATIPSMIREAGILQQVLSYFIQENLLGADISSLIPDVMRIGESLQAYLERSIREYLHARHAFTRGEAHDRQRSLLLLCADRELSLMSEYPLRQAGYSVTRADSRKDALRFLGHHFDALVITHSILADGIAEITTLFREQNPNSPIIAVAKGRWQDFKVDTDHAISGEEGPEALVEAVETALMRKQLRRVK